uniref:TRPM SLOG domain-containing protein n=1 Tax=Globodera rostochiensis TaxID=31243 RepID=A0A914HUY9_GLORO
MAVALEQAIPTSKIHNKIVSVGIAPWGLLKRREDFVGRDKSCPLSSAKLSSQNTFGVLNNRGIRNFLLVDNGTVGRFKADIISSAVVWRTYTIRAVLDYMTTTPKVPVVICDGSGRASNLLAFAHRYIQEDGNLSEGVRPQLLSIIEDVFFYDKHDAHFSYYGHFGMRSPTKFAHCLSPWGGLETGCGLCHSDCSFEGHNLSPVEQLSLAFAWNRVDNGTGLAQYGAQQRNDGGNGLLDD